METYAEPDFSGVLDEFCDDIMTPEQQEVTRKRLKKCIIISQTMTGGT